MTKSVGYLKTCEILKSLSNQNNQFLFFYFNVYYKLFFKFLMD